MTPRIAIILVNYGDYAQKHLGNCYASLTAQDLPREQFSLFIVDNQSTEERRSQIRQLAPSARLIPEARNLGWSGGNNLALSQALPEGFDLFLFLNIDTRLEPTCLRRLAEKAQEKGAAEILQPKILLGDSGLINSMGNRIQFLGFGTCLGYGQPEEGLLPAPMDYASGACMLIRRQVFEKIGLFREEYFLYYDDMEFCWRARLAGFRVGLVPQAVCRHKYDFRKMRGYLYYLERNRFLTLLTLEKIPTLLLIGPALLLFQAGATLYFIGSGSGRAVFQVLRAFLSTSTWRMICRYRHEAAGLRRFGDRLIVRDFAAQIRFAEIRNRFFQFIVNPLLRLYWSAARRLLIW